MQSRTRDVGTPPREGLELLVGLADAVTTHDRLDRLREHLPCLLEVLVDARAVDGELGEPLQRRAVGDDAVPERHADVAQHGRVAEVALPSAYRQFLGQMAEHGIGHTQVALGVLEVDGINLVRHCRRAHFAGHRLLREIAERDVAPDVPTEVDKHRVEPRDCMKELGQVVVRFDLRRERAVSETQGFDEALRQAGPVDSGIGREVGVEIAHRTVDFAEQRYGGDAAALHAQPLDDVAQLLADGRRGGGLAVRS